MMKTITATLVLLTFGLMTSNAKAQETVKGTWTIQTVRHVETPEDETLTLTFADQGKATLTSASKGEVPQSWAYAYTVSDTQLTLRTTNAPGKPNPKTYDMLFKDGKLLLFEPRPETEEGEDSDLPEDRKPVWVLVKQ